MRAGKERRDLGGIFFDDLNKLVVGAALCEIWGWRKEWRGLDESLFGDLNE